MTMKANKLTLFQSHKEDFAYCETIIKKHSKTFYAAFSALPKEKAMSVYAVYAFCRKADDLVDEESDLEGLQRLEEEVRLFEEGREIDHPVWRALRVVWENYEMDLKPFYEMIEGQRMDLNFKQPQTQADLENYSYYVAGSVGLMLLPLLTTNPKKVHQQAIALGTAMQITNILRDIGEDNRNGRVYLPKDKMVEFGYSQDLLDRQVINHEFIQLWEYEAQEAENLYEEALNLIPNLTQDAKRPLLLSLLLYRGILDAVRDNYYDCFSQKNKVGKLKQLELFKTADKMLK